MITQVGVTLPLKIVDGSCPLTNGRNELLLERVANIINTPLYQPQFSYKIGCRLYELIGEPATDIIPVLAKQFVQSSFNELDCGVIVTDVVTYRDNNKLTVNIYMVDKLTGEPLKYSTTL